MNEETQKQLEITYERGLRAEKQGDFATAAEAYRQMLTLDGEDCAGAAVRLAAIGRGKTPPAAPKAYIATLFDQHADVFDMILVDLLGYDVPNLLFEEISRHYQGRIFKNLLDLGCGTGLVGEAFDSLAAAKTGIDLSENMIEMAAEREIYDNLYVGDAVQFLREIANAGEGQAAGQAQWDLIIAADVLPYMGELDDFFASTAGVLEKGGVFAFSSENLLKTALSEQRQSEQDENYADFAVGPHQRFAHSPDYIAETLKKAGLKPVFSADIIVRREQDSPVYGQLILSAKL